MVLEGGIDFGATVTTGGAGAGGNGSAGEVGGDDDAEDSDPSNVSGTKRTINIIFLVPTGDRHGEVEEGYTERNAIATVIITYQRFRDAATIHSQSSAPVRA